MLITPIYYLSILLCFENIVVQGLRYKESINQTVELLDIEILQQDKSLPKETESSDVLSNYNIDGINTMTSAKVLIKNDEIIDNKKGNKINMTGDITKYNTENEGLPNKLTTITKNRLKPTSEANSNNYNGTETYLIMDETTLSDLTTEDNSEKISIIIVSSSETTSTLVNSLIPTNDSTSMEPLTNEIEKMSSGIIAVVMAIVFAIVVILVYIGLLIWRRYLEYQYGNRELLVNDLEFDTNDLHHFEL